ncbi:head decoration protein [Microvirga brassicacearum]|uniref:Head decoration protein n=1 Tax=Microvirga brassicacearum TaxID=2580413 RepID=A0A5N3PH71_9HYPH|nr:head decoration protein [Microvirga brassicacearum]KAB0269059.1 head decoration protein [Microvirga brassicacearum]
MPVLTEGVHPGEFIMSEAGWHRSRDAITIVAGSGVVTAGTVLGKVIASGKYAPSPATGADGSQVGSAINIYTVDATSVDVKVSAITRDAEVNKNCLLYAVTVNDATKKGVKNSELAAVGIITR